MPSDHANWIKLFLHRERYNITKAHESDQIRVENLYCWSTYVGHFHFLQIGGTGHCYSTGSLLGWHAAAGEGEYIYSNCFMYLSKLQIAFVQITKYICPDTLISLFKFHSYNFDQEIWRGCGGGWGVVALEETNFSLDLVGHCCNVGHRWSWTQMKAKSGRAAPASS